METLKLARIRYIACTACGKKLIHLEDLIDHHQKEHLTNDRFNIILK